MKVDPHHFVLKGLTCAKCNREIETTSFVQCPANPQHRFCFQCTREYFEMCKTIHRLQKSKEVFNCPSDEKCRVSRAPWSFLRSDITKIYEGI